MENERAPSQGWTHTHNTHMYTQSHAQLDSGGRETETETENLKENLREGERERESLVGLSIGHGLS